MRRFQNVEIREPSIDETVDILNGLKAGYEAFHGVIYEDGLIDYAVNMSAKYINERFLPDKAIDLIDEAASKASLQPPENSENIHKINEELQQLLEKAKKEGTKIMPLIVRPCAFFEENGLSKYQAVNDPKLPLSGMSEYEQERKLVEMVNNIKEIIKQ